MIWDRGRWHPEGDPHAGYKKGHLDFTLDGEKLHGRWHLVRMHGRPGEKKEPWLLIKSNDDAAAPPRRSGHSRGHAAVGGERPLDPGNRRGQRRQAGVALE